MIMKLIIQIPCYNEEDSLPITLKDLPRKVEGFEQVEWLIIDDGSSDRTIEVAKELGVDHIVSFANNQGLARGFMLGIESSLKAGADVIVNTDADNQYNGADIPRLVAPILKGDAEIVVGERPISETGHFSPLKKLLQRLGSWVVRLASRTTVPDAPSGFRAFSRSAAMRLNVFNRYTYTIETIIQAGKKNISITSVPIRTNPDLRKSRLVKSIFSYVKKSLTTIIRIFVVYNPFRIFMTLGIILFGLGLLPGFRFLYYFFNGQGDGHIQSLILAAILTIMGVQMGMIAFIGDLHAVNRHLMEDIQYMLRREHYSEEKVKKEHEEDHEEQYSRK